MNFQYDIKNDGYITHFTEHKNRNLSMNLKFVTTYLKSYTKRSVHFHKPYKCKTGTNVFTDKTFLTKFGCYISTFFNDFN